MPLGVAFNPDLGLIAIRYLVTNGIHEGAADTLSPRAGMDEQPGDGAPEPGAFRARDQGREAYDVAIAAGE
jgi:hypothetical protein